MPNEMQGHFKDVRIQEAHCDLPALNAVLHRAGPGLSSAAVKVCLFASILINTFNQKKQYRAQNNSIVQQELIYLAIAHMKLLLPRGLSEQIGRVWQFINKL